MTESIQRVNLPKTPLNPAPKAPVPLPKTATPGLTGDRFNQSNPHQSADAAEERIIKIIGKQPNPTLSFIMRAGEELQDGNARLAWYEAVLRDHDLPATDTDASAARIMIGRLGTDFIDAPVGIPRMKDSRATQFGLRALEAIKDDTQVLAQFAHDQAQRLRNPAEARNLIRDALVQMHELPEDVTPADAALLAATFAVERINGTTGDLSEAERADMGLAALEQVAKTFKDPYLKSQFNLAKNERSLEERLAIVHEALMAAL